jgi:hypothetical protein
MRAAPALYDFQDRLLVVIMVAMGKRRAKAKVRPSGPLPSKVTGPAALSRPVHPTHPAIIDAPPESYTGVAIGITGVVYPGWKVGRGKK